MHQEQRMIAKTLQTLEPVLAQELEALGATDLEVGRRMVSFSGDKKLLYSANYRLRTALRVLLPIASFRATDPDMLYQQLRALDWTQWMRPSDSFAFDAVVYSETFTHHKYVGYRAKDALVDFFVARGEARPAVRLDHPDLRFHIHISHDEVTLALDSSGESLHKRGWRAAQTEAPMSEVLAAGILHLAGWQGQSDFLDPMCGSGTLLVEAALMARNIAPGRYRPSFAFQRWRDYDADLFAEVKAEAEAAQRPFDYHIYGSDSAIEAVQIARHNVRLANLGEHISILHRSLQQCPPPERPLLLVTNPPYGERLRLREGEDLYQMIGERLKHNFAGSSAWILAYKQEHFSAIGLRQSIRHKLLNGSLECELRGYELFAGKRAERPASSERPAEGRAERKPLGDRPARKPRPTRQAGASGSERPQRPARSFDRPAGGERRPRRERPEGRRPQSQPWPNDRFRYRDESGRERLRTKRPSHIQVFSDEED